jgi:hypothetical protein
MKKFFIIPILAVMVAAGTTLMAQSYPDEYLGLPGDNLNLYAVMKLFQESETLEGFERSLNDENTRINNLDLNGDNLIDYIKVIDYVDRDVHTIVLQAVLNRKESQDVAVFTVQKYRNGSVQIQLTGDEALYGRNYIIEPINNETPNPGYAGSSNRYNETVVRTTYVEVSAWPLIRFLFVPNYVIWNSSWYWGYYPSYWHPWRPYYWHYYYGYHYNWFPHYYGHYHHCDYHRYSHWDENYYYSKRVCSSNVSMRINSGHYKATYSHPEQRRDGEKLYAKVHPERVSSLSTGNNQGRRSDSQLSAYRQTEVANNNTSRRSTTTADEQKAVNSSSGHSSGNVRRSSAPVNDRTSTNSSVRKNTGTESRSSTTVNDRARKNSSSQQNTVNVHRPSSVVKDKDKTNYAGHQNSDNNRRSSEAVNSRPVSKHESGQRIEKSQASKQLSASVSSSVRRISEKSKTETAVKKSSNSKEPGKSVTSRRK